MRALRRQNNPYPIGDPRYSPTLEEELAWIRGVTVEQARDFHAQFYGANNGELAIVGDFDAEPMRALVTELLGDWGSRAAYARVPEPFVPNKSGMLKFDAPDKANAFLIGRESLPLNDANPDYAALIAANYLLGDSPSSRLWERLRQKDGLSYGVGTFFRANPFEANSTLTLYAIFAPENFERVRTGFADEMAKALKDGFTDAEVTHAKSGILEERTAQRSEDANVAQALIGQSYLGRTWARDAAVDGALSRLTAADVNAALVKFLTPGELAYAVAGNFK